MVQKINLAEKLGSFEEPWKPKIVAELMERLDALTGTDVFGRLYFRHVHSRTFPDLNEVYRRLGIDTHKGQLRFRNDAPLVEARRAIMASPEDRI